MLLHRNPLRLIPTACAILLATAASSFGGPIITLARFNGADGASPRAGLLYWGGDLYGTTALGGANYGTLFRLNPATRSLSTLVTFNFTNGGSPNAGLIVDAAGNLYGTTRTGGPGSLGTVFELPAGASTVSTLATFSGPNGGNPKGSLLMDASGNLYGTCNGGGTSSQGTVFEVSAATHQLTTLVNLDGTHGANPSSGLIADADGNLYGTAIAGGASSHGVVFEVAAGTHALSTLATFNGPNGSGPEQPLLADASGNLYGTTFEGGASNQGTVFELTAGSHTLLTLATFNGNNGSFPEGTSGLIADAAGNLYGTTYAGSASNYGSVFELTAGTHRLEMLAAFNGTNGQGPFAGLTADASGNLYGTTASDVTNQDGTVFELSGTGFVVPEPTSLALLALASPMLLTRCRQGQPLS